MPKNKSLINLLPQEEFDSSVVGRVLKWAMGTFRIIVIVTEMIVMGAFLSRFWLDAQNSDLNDAIKIRAAQIIAQSDFEIEFKDLQIKLDVIKKVKETWKRTEIIEAIGSKIPSGLNLTSIAIQDAGVQIKGMAGSELGIAQFISNLKTISKFKTVDLGQINSSENNQSQIVYTIKLTL